MHLSSKLAPGLAFAMVTIYVAALGTVAGMGLVDDLFGIAKGENPLVAYPFASAGLACVLTLCGALAVAWLDANRAHHASE